MVDLGSVVSVVYDQDCGVCGATVEWLRKRDPSLSFVGNLAEALPPGVPREETGETVFVVDATGQVWRRAAAIARLLRGIPGLAALGWRMLGGLLTLPGIAWLAERGYRAFARRRHRVSALLGLKACKLPEGRAHGS